MGSLNDAPANDVYQTTCLQIWRRPIKAVHGRRPCKLLVPSVVGFFVWLTAGEPILRKTATAAIDNAPSILVRMKPP